MQAEIAHHIVQVLESTGMGRRWLEENGRRLDLERRLYALCARGLADRIVSDLWHIGDLDLLPPLEAATPAGIAALNAAP